MSMRVNGEAVRTLRERDGRDLRSLADAAGISYQHLGAIEIGRYGASPRTIRKLALALQVPISMLIKPISQEGARQ